MPRTTTANKLNVLEDQLPPNGKTMRPTEPYTMSVSIAGVAPLIFHAWSIKSDDETGGKGDNKHDDLESYTYRDEDKYLCIPGVCFCACIREAGRNRKDPRNAKASMRELIKSSIFPQTVLARLDPETKEWDFDHACRAVINRAAVTRVRPAMRDGWKATFEIVVAQPQYFPPHLVLDLIGDAGRFYGLCDFRPQYGRFTVAAHHIVNNL